MTLMELLKEKLYNYVFDTSNPIKCYELGLVYEALGHTAAGLTFFLKAAERTDDKELQYECLLRMHKTFEVQKNRNTTAIAMAQRAIIECPKRPEAYYLLSRFYEIHNDHHQALTYANLALEFADFDSKPLRGDVGYPGKYGVLFQKGVNSWWWGMRDQSKEIMTNLIKDYYSVMDQNHINAITSNLVKMGVDVGEIISGVQKKNYWKATQWPTLEITTNIAEKGCVVDCAFCPQRTLEKTYKADIRRLTLENFKKVIDKLPKEVRITFAGFTEPWLNKDATDMLLYAYERGHKVAGFTTGVGMKPEDVYRLKDVKFDGGPNGGFCLHLPDQDRIAKHPINANFIKVIKAFKEVGPSIQNFYVMCMSEQVHESVRHLFPTAHVPEFWSRAGNLLTEVGVKPDLAKVMSKVKSIDHGDKEMTCNQPEDLYHNILLPNGDVSLCCQDYSLKHILGNLFTQEYDDILPKTQSCFDLCKLCENGVKPK